MSPPANQITRDFAVAGSSFIPGGWDRITRIRPNARVYLRREPDNKYDPNAVRVYADERMLSGLGYLPRGLAKDVAPLMDNGVTVIAQRKAVAHANMFRIAWVPPDAIKPPVRQLDVI